MAVEPSTKKRSTKVLTMVAVLSFLLGLYAGMQVTQATTASTSLPFGATTTTMANHNEHEHEQQQQQQDLALSTCLEEKESLIRSLSAAQKAAAAQDTPHNNHPNPRPLFGPAVARIATGAARVSKADFMQVFDYGLPTARHAETGQSQVLLFYPNAVTLPPNMTRTSTTHNNQEDAAVPLLSLTEALTNCHDVNVVYLKHEAQASLDRCLALVAGPGAHHVLRWRKKRQEDSQQQSSKVQSLSYERVGLRGEKGRFLSVPGPSAEALHRQRMLTFLTHLDDALHTLKPMVERAVASSSRRNTAVVVMTCNAGYLPLLLNFVCASRARALDLSQLLVFATDQASYDAASSWGLTVFFTETIFGSLSTEMAQTFADKTFGEMTYAKMVSVLLVNMLGFDVLFQDCDVIWYKNPLELFWNQTSLLNNYDIIFMDDGNSSWEYAPFQANTGFFFVRHNERTRYLFTDFLFSGDLVARIGVDQSVMGHLLNQHSALHGLRVKTMDWHVFPGGREFGSQQPWVNGLIEAAQAGRTEEAYIFHMHWTANRVHKVDYMRQAAMWYVREECIDKKAHEGSFTLDGCCSPEPLISCHIPTKPSVKECREQWQQKK